MIFRLSQAAKYLGISKRSLQSKVYSGNIKSSFKTDGGHHRFRKSDLDRYLGIKEELPDRKVVIYARVSTGGQSDVLLRQKGDLIDYCNKNELTPYVVIDDIASGLNADRRGIEQGISVSYE